LNAHVSGGGSAAAASWAANPAMELLNTEWAKQLMKTHLLEGRVLVRAVFDPALVARGVAPGTEIVAVDGVPVKTYAGREIVPYVNASTPQDLDARTYGFQFLQGPVAGEPRLRRARRIVPGRPRAPVHRTGGGAHFRRHLFRGRGLHGRVRQHEARPDRWRSHRRQHWPAADAVAADGRMWVGTGILPTVKAAPLLADLRLGRDTVLEAALAALRK
jgi:hypothetical protein